MQKLNPLIDRAVTIQNYPYKVSFDENSSTSNFYWICSVCEKKSSSLNKKVPLHSSICSFKNEKIRIHGPEMICVVGPNSQGRNEVTRRAGELMKFLAIERFGSAQMKNPQKIVKSTFEEEILTELKKIEAKKKENAELSSSTFNTDAFFK